MFAGLGMMTVWRVNAAFSLLAALVELRGDTGRVWSRWGWYYGLSMFWFRIRTWGVGGGVVAGIWWWDGGLRGVWEGLGVLEECWVLPGMNMECEE